MIECTHHPQFAYCGHMAIHLSYHSAQGLVQLCMAAGFTIGPPLGGWLQEVR